MDFLNLNLVGYLAGVGIHVTSKIVDARQESGSWSLAAHNYNPRNALAALAAFGAWQSGALAAVLPINLTVDPWTSVMAGYMLDSFVKNIVPVAKANGGGK